MEFVSTPKQYVDAVGYAARQHLRHIARPVAFRCGSRLLIQCTFQGGELGGIARADVKDAMVVEVTGDVHEEPRAEHGFEVVLTGITILARPAEQLPVPLGKKYMGLSLDVDLPLRPITLRHPRKRAVFRIQDAIAEGFSEYMIRQGFTRIHTPKIVSAGAEGGANIFGLTISGGGPFGPVPSSTNGSIPQVCWPRI